MSTPSWPDFLIDEEEARRRYIVAEARRRQHQAEVARITRNKHLALAGIAGILVFCAVFFGIPFLLWGISGVVGILGCVPVPLGIAGKVLAEEMSVSHRYDRRSFSGRFEMRSDLDRANRPFSWPYTFPFRCSSEAYTVL